MKTKDFDYVAMHGYDITMVGQNPKKWPPDTGKTLWKHDGILHVFWDDTAMDTFYWLLAGRKPRPLWAGMNARTIQVKHPIL